jgi:galactose oxidase-like protein
MLQTRRPLLAAAAAFFALLPAGVLCVDAQVADRWDPPSGAPITIRDSGVGDLWPMHGAVVPVPSGSGHNPDAVEIWIIGIDPANAGKAVYVLTPGGVPAGRIQMVSSKFPAPLVDPVNDHLSCSGHTLMADGTFFVAGGWNVGSMPTEYGTDYAMTFDPGVGGRSRVAQRISPAMAGAGPLGTSKRWYPTCTSLADGRILVTGGFEEVGPAYNHSVEAYAPGSGWQVLSSDGASPTDLFTWDYPHVYQLPQNVGGFDLLIQGRAGGHPFLMSSDPGAPARWGSFSNPTRPGGTGDIGSSGTLLPLRLNNGEWGYSNGSTLLAGGAHDLSIASHLDVYDPSSNQWQATRVMSIGGQEVARQYCDTVLLPDGQVLVLGGRSTTDYEVEHAQYVNPRNGFSITHGANPSPELRGYHSVALLLPDGRVFLASGHYNMTWSDASMQFHRNFRYYYPAYLSAASRPVLTSAPANVGYGSSFNVGFTGGPLSEVVLLRLGSMTHAFDCNQRYIQLALTSQSGTGAVVQGPPNDRTAPPGYYMLFALDSARTPSIAKIVHVSSIGGGGGALPSPWQQSDIGTVGVAGSATYASGMFAVSGSGSDIWGTADGFHFVYRSMTGDGEIAARVTDPGAGGSWVKSGVMIRENLSAGSANAATFLTPGNGIDFQRRKVAGGPSTYTAGPMVGPPQWVKLVRRGDTFTGYNSADGTTWTQAGTDTIPMAATVYAGLAVSSLDDGALNTATFDSTSLTAGGSGVRSGGGGGGGCGATGLEWLALALFRLLRNRR